MEVNFPLKVGFGPHEEAKVIFFFAVSESFAFECLGAFSIYEVR